MRLTMHLRSSFTHGLTPSRLARCSHSSYRPAAATTHTIEQGCAGRRRSAEGWELGPTRGHRRRIRRCHSGERLPRGATRAGRALSNASGSLHVLARWSVRLAARPAAPVHRRANGSPRRLPSAAMREWRVDDAGSDGRRTRVIGAGGLRASRRVSADVTLSAA